MAKGFKLKELLAHQKAVEKEDKEVEAKKSKKDAALVVEEPTVISHEDVVRAKDSQKSDTSKAIESEEYKSSALSKKEKRKLKKQQKKEVQDEDKDEEDDDDDEQEHLDLNKLSQTADSEEEEEEDAEESEAEEKEVEEEDVPLSDVEFDSDADIVPHHKLTVNNTKAMKHALERIQLPWKKHSFQEHQSITSAEPADAKIKDIYDDTERELAFYKQSLDAVSAAREELKRLKVPFLRPLDYFAEMVKNDEHMDKIKGKLVREASEKKAREDARKQRNLKKFGKQVQNATLQRRQLEKKDALDKIKDLKKKRKASEITGDDFNVGVEEVTEDNNRRWENGRPSGKRSAKNAKYGQGGLKRFKRKNDADSSADVSGFSAKKMKGKRPGKSRRTKRF